VLKGNSERRAIYFRAVLGDTHLGSGLETYCYDFICITIILITITIAITISSIIIMIINVIIIIVIIIIIIIIIISIIIIIIITIIIVVIIISIVIVIIIIVIIFTVIIIITWRDGKRPLTCGSLHYRIDSGWLQPIVDGLDATLIYLQHGLDQLHVPYSYGWAIISLTLLTKVLTFPFTRIQVRPLGSYPKQMCSEPFSCATCEVSHVESSRVIIILLSAIYLQSTM
jgi:hypothetical protein